MPERRTFIIRVHPPDDLPILEDVATGELIRLAGLASIPHELSRRLHGSEEIAITLLDKPSAPLEQ